MKSTRIGLAVLLAVTVPAWAAGFKVVSTTIDPAPNQRITVEATGVDAIQGMDLVVHAEGAPLAITGIEIVGTIWESNNTGPDIFVYPSEGLADARLGLMSVSTATGVVASPGTAAIVMVDATGLGGQTATLTANYAEYPSDWAGGPIDGYEDGTIIVRAAAPPSENQHPVVDAGPDQVVTSGDLVQLSGNATDPEGAALTYLWWRISGPAVQLSSTTIANPTFTAPDVSVATPVEFQFRASDPSLTWTDTIVVTVNPKPVTPPTDPDYPPPGDGPGDPPPPPADPGDTNNPPPPPPGSSDPSTVTPEPGNSGNATTNTGSNTNTSNANSNQGSDSSGSTNESDDTETHAPAGAPACAMGIADAALLVCAGMWLMLLRPIRRAEREIHT